AVEGRVERVDRRPGHGATLSEPLLTRPPRVWSRASPARPARSCPSRPLGAGRPSGGGVTRSLHTWHTRPASEVRDLPDCWGLAARCTVGRMQIPANRLASFGGGPAPLPPRVAP